MSVDRLFRIGDFVFRVKTPEGIALPPNFMLFACGAQEEAAYTYTMELADAFPQPQGKAAVCHSDLMVFLRGDLEMRYIGIKGAQGYYAYYEETDEAHAHVLLARTAVDMMRSDPVWLSLLAMERRMIARSAMTLHCAYMRYKDEAILFSAPSGMGKTTQATLWEKHRGSRVINGDKALLREIEGRWTACGWPVCGSSGVCHDEDTPIRAIVMLSQGKTDTIRRLSPFQAFTQIYTQVTVNSWNRDAQQRAMDLIERLASQVPVYHLSCTISEDAVRCLEEALGG